MNDELVTVSISDLNEIMTAASNIYEQAGGDDEYLDNLSECMQRCGHAIAELPPKPPPAELQKDNGKPIMHDIPPENRYP